MANPYLFIDKEMRPEIMKKYDIYPITIDEAIEGALKRFSTVLYDKKDGVDCGKDSKDSKESPKDGKDGKEGKEGSDDKEACDGIMTIQFGLLDNVEKFLKPIF